MKIESKLPRVGTTIFTVMSQLAEKHGAVNLGQGFPNFDPSIRLQKLVSEAMRKGHNQYAPMPGSMLLRERIAEKIERLYNRKIDPATEITITAGATQAIFCIIAAFIRPNDEVILIEPAYDSYAPSVEVVGGRVVVHSLSKPNYAIDFEALKKQINDRTKMIVLNTPHNPTGTTIKKEDYLKLEQLVQNTDIIILNDEVYEHLIFDNKEHQSIARFDRFWERGFATFSFGKTFHNTGWKIGYAIGPADLMAEFRKVHQFNVFAVNHPVQAALAEFLKDDSEWLELADFYQKKRDFFRKILEQTRFRPLKCEGTYFQLADFSAISDAPDFDFAKKLIVENRVATIPTSVFYSDKKDEKTVRFCFAKTEELLEKAGEFLIRV